MQGHSLKFILTDILWNDEIRRGEIDKMISIILDKYVKRKKKNWSRRGIWCLETPNVYV